MRIIWRSHATWWKWKVWRATGVAGRLADTLARKCFAREVCGAWGNEPLRPASAACFCIIWNGRTPHSGRWWKHWSQIKKHFQRIALITVKFLDSSSSIYSKSCSNAAKFPRNSSRTQFCATPPNSKEVHMPTAMLTMLLRPWRKHRNAMPTTNPPSNPVVSDAFRPGQRNLSW